jgi:predicted NodU family carbamoyl transferase
MLLNTSLNLAGEPLVQTKLEAVDVLNNSDLDYIYFVDENKLISKKEDK